MPEDYLLVTEGASQGGRADIGDHPVTIGREDDNDLVLDDSQASRRHARVARGAAGFTVEDLGSTNGTYLNGGRLSGVQPLRAGDEIRIGRTVIALRSTAAHTEIGSPEDLGFTDLAPAVDAPAAPVPPPPAPAPAAQAPPPPPPPAPAPPPPPPPAPGRPGLAAPQEDHGYPAARPLTGHHPPAPQGPPPPAYRAVPEWQGAIPGERSPASGIRALQSDRQVRQRAYLVTFVVVALVALAVVLYLVTR